MMLKKYLPNILSLSRVFITPLFLITLSHNLRLFSFVLLFLGASSDFFDGYAARKLKVESAFGEMLDPIADKIFSNGVLWGLYAYKGHPFPLLLIASTLTIRDLFLICGGVFIVVKNLKISMKPVYISKVCTTLLFLIAIHSVVLGTDGLYFEIINYICLCTIFISFAIYAKNFLTR